MISRKLACLALVAPFGLWSAAANASFYTGAELYKVCTTSRESKAYVDQTYECIAYITGAVDAFKTTRNVTKVKSCIPADVTISQLRTVTIDYLRQNPKLRSESASDLVFAATRTAWPCTGKKAR